MKKWTVERASLEESNLYLTQESEFLKNELDQYKVSHDNMIKEIERLKKYIDDLEDENDEYKQHLAQFITNQEHKQANQ